MTRDGSRNPKAAAAVAAPNAKQSPKRSSSGRGRAKRKAPKSDVKMQTLEALLHRIGYYLHISEQMRDFQVFEITEMIEESDWGDIPVEHVLDAWTDLQNQPRGLFMCVEVDPDGDGDPEKDWYRSTHLTFQGKEFTRTLPAVCDLLGLV